MKGTINTIFELRKIINLTKHFSVFYIKSLLPFIGIIVSRIHIEGDVFLISYLFGVFTTTPEKPRRLNAEVPNLFFVPIYDCDAVLFLDGLVLLFLLFTVFLAATLALFRHLGTKQF